MRTEGTLAEPFFCPFYWGEKVNARVNPFRLHEKITECSSNEEIGWDIFWGYDKFDCSSVIVLHDTKKSAENKAA